MPQKKKRKLSRKQIAALITAGVAVFVAIVLIIINAFIPVKYLSSYFVSKSVNEVGQARVSYLDVGNADCTLVELPDGRILLIDGGDGTYSHNLKVLKELNRRGVDKIDYLICSSVKNDGCGGFAEILKYKTVDEVFAPYCSLKDISDGYKTFCAELERQEKEVTFCEYGAGVFNDEAGYSFCFLSPDSHLYDGEYSELLKDPSYKNINNASAIIWLECCGVNFLFLGSTDGTVQKKLLDTYNSTGIDIRGRYIDLTACNIVKASEHGSTDGAFAPFLDLIDADAAIISVGENGRGFPTLSALANFQNSVQNNIFRTDELGTLTVTVKNGDYEIFKEKK